MAKSQFPTTASVPDIPMQVLLPLLSNPLLHMQSNEPIVLPHVEETSSHVSVFRAHSSASNRTYQNMIAVPIHSAKNVKLRIPTLSAVFIEFKGKK